MSVKSDYAITCVVLIILSATIGYLLAYLIAVKPAQKLNALHTQAWEYATNLDAGSKIIDSFVLPVKVHDAPAGSLVLRIQKDEKDQYVVFLRRDIIHLEVSQLIPRQE